jgi:hypothetical protein
LFWDTFNLSPSIKVRTQVSWPYNTTGKTTVCFSLSLLIWKKNRFITVYELIITSTSRIYSSPYESHFYFTVQYNDHLSSLSKQM